MELNYKTLKELGFKAATRKPSDLYTGLFYRIRDNKVEYIDSLSPNAIGVFKLTDSELEQFRAGQLSLLPPGFRRPPDAGKTKGGAKVLYMGRISCPEFIQKTFDSYIDSNMLEQALRTKYQRGMWAAK